MENLTGIHLIFEVNSAKTLKLGQHLFDPCDLENTSMSIIFLSALWMVPRNYHVNFEWNDCKMSWEKFSDKVTGGGHSFGNDTNI